MCSKKYVENVNIQYKYTLLVLVDLIVKLDLNSFVCDNKIVSPFLCDRWEKRGDWSWRHTCKTQSQAITEGIRFCPPCSRDRPSLHSVKSDWIRGVFKTGQLIWHDKQVPRTKQKWRNTWSNELGFHVHLNKCLLLINHCLTSQRKLVWKFEHTFLWKKTCCTFPNDPSCCHVATRLRILLLNLGRVLCPHRF